MRFYCCSVSYRSSTMTVKMFIVKILLINIQLDQNIAKTCALHSLLPVTHTTDNMKIVLQKMKMNLLTNSIQTFQGIVMNEIGHTNVIKLQNGLGKMKKRKRKAVIRWHNFNIEKEPKKHYKSRIMLFLPWRAEEKLRGHYMSYEDRYNDEIERINATEKMFIHHEDEINSAFDHLQAARPPQAAWDNIAPGAEEAEELAHQEGISDECPMAEEDIQHHISQIVNDRPQSYNESLNTKYTKEARKELLSPREYNKCM